MMRPRRPLAALLVSLALLGPASAPAEDLSSFEAILLPLFLPDPAPGRHGAVFQTGRSPVVHSTAPFHFYPYTLPDAPPGTPPWIGEGVPGWNAITFRGERTAGRFLFLRSDPPGAVRLAWTLRTVDGDEPAGADPRAHAEALTSLPVVPVSRFVAGESFVLSLPMYWRYPAGVPYATPVPAGRAALRIYLAPGSEPMAFEAALSLEALPSQEPMRRFTVTADRRDGADASYPAYAEVDLPYVCIPFSAHTPCWSSFTYRLHLVPADPAVRYHAFVAIVDNESSHVQLLPAR